MRGVVWWIAASFVLAAGCGDTDSVECGDGTRLQDGTCVLDEGRQSSNEMQRADGSAGSAGRGGPGIDSGLPTDPGADAAADGARDGGQDAGHMDAGPPADSGTPGGQDAGQTDAGPPADSGADAGDPEPRVAWLAYAIEDEIRGVDYSAYPFPETFTVGANPTSLSFSPNGTRLLSNTHAFAVTDSDVEAISQLGASEFTRWSPDSRHIALMRLQGGSRDLYVLDTDQSLPVQELVEEGAFISSQSGLEFELAWSPDARFLVYARSGPLQLAMATIEAGKVTRHDALTDLTALGFGFYPCRAVERRWIESVRRARH